MTRYVTFSRILSFLFAILYLILSSGQVFALSSRQKELIAQGIYYYDPEARNCEVGSTTTASSLVAGSTVYMLGDSITQGASENLTTEFTQKSLVVEKINGVVGRSITAPGSGNETGLQAIDNDEASIASASVIVVALGTNPSGANEEGIKNMIDKILNKK